MTEYPYETQLKCDKCGENKWWISMQSLICPACLEELVARYREKVNKEVNDAE